MKQIIGLFMILAGVALGLYVGVWICFIGGIVQIIDAIKAPDVVAMPIAIGAAKVIFAGISGVLSGALLVLPGWVMVNE